MAEAEVEGSSPALARVRVSGDRLMCPICLEVFRQPATLPCGHSFCLACIERLWEQPAAGGGYSCPQCRQSFSPRPALRPNPILGDIAEELVAEAEADKEGAAGAGAGPMTPCDVCPAARLPAARSCLLCLASYCERHLRPHRLNAAFRDHPLAPPATDVGRRKCAPHRKHLELFCRTDRTFICGLCLAAEHREHQVVSLDQEAESRRKELQKTDLEMGKQLQETLLAIGSLQQNMDSIVRSSQKVELEITNHFSAMTESLDEALRVVIEIIGREQQAALTEAKATRTQLEQKCMELREKKLQLEILANKSDNFKLVQDSLCFSNVSQVPDVPQFKSDFDFKLARASRAAAELSSQVKECLRRAMKRRVRSTERRGCDKSAETSDLSCHTSLDSPEPKIRRSFEEPLPSQSIAAVSPTHTHQVLSSRHCRCHTADF